MIGIDLLTKKGAVRKVAKEADSQKDLAPDQGIKMETVKARVVLKVFLDPTRKKRKYQ